MYRNRRKEDVTLVHPTSLIHARQDEVSEITRDKVIGESEVMQWRQVSCNGR